MTSRTPKDDRILHMYEMLQAAPDGLTLPQMAFMMGIQPESARPIVQGLRDFLGEYEEENVPCDPDPDNPTGPFIYKLVRTYGEGEGWIGKMMRDLQRRLITMHQEVTSWERAADKRTVDGRKVRRVKKDLERIIEDMEDLEL